MQHQLLAALMDFWEQERGAEPLPSRSCFTMSRLRPWAENLVWIHSVPTQGLIFGTCGEELYARFAGNPEGKALGNLDDEVVRTLRVSLERVFQTRKPMFSLHMSPVRGEYHSYHEVCLPLLDEKSRGQTMLIGSYRTSRPVTAAVAAALEATNKHIVHLSAPGRGTLR